MLVSIKVINLHPKTQIIYLLRSLFTYGIEAFLLVLYCAKRLRSRWFGLSENRKYIIT